MTKPPTNAGTDVGTVCSQCEHEWSQHAFVERELDQHAKPRTQVWQGIYRFKCEACTCVYEWTPAQPTKT